LIVLIGSILRFFWIPHGQIVFYDGFNWVSMAMSIKEHGFYGLCEFYFNGFCYHFSTISWPPAYHVFLSFFVKGERVGFYVSSLLGTFMIFLVFALSYLWTKKENISLVGALVFGLMPPILKFSGGISLQFFSLIPLIFSLIFFEMFCKKKEKSMFFLFLTSLLILVYSRPEHLLMIFLFFLFMIIRLKKDEKYFFSSFFYVVFFSIPAIILIYHGVVVAGHEGWAPSLLETKTYFIKHFTSNVCFFFDFSKNIFLFVFLSIYGFFITFLKEKKKWYFFFIFFLFYFSLYSGFDMGEFYKNEIRYSLILYVPLFFFFIKGTDFFFSKFQKKRIVFILLFLVIFIVNFVLTIPYIFEEEEYKVAVDVLFLSKDHIDDNAYVISSSSAIIKSTIEKNVIALNYFPQLSTEIKDKKLFLFQDVWFDSELSPAEVTFVYENYNLIPVKVLENKNGLSNGIYMLIEKEKNEKN
jgi:hypothetical protein